MSFKARIITFYAFEHADNCGCSLSFSYASNFTFSSIPTYLFNCARFVRAVCKRQAEDIVVSRKFDLKFLAHAIPYMFVCAFHLGIARIHTLMGMNM